MTYTEIKKVADNLTKYIDNLNKKKDKTYGE